MAENDGPDGPGFGASDDGDSVSQALRAPGTPAELVDEDRYRAMFRAVAAAGGAGAPIATVTPLLHRRNARRAGAGAALAVTFALATGGVAAAYTGNLPKPLQTLVVKVVAPLPIFPKPPPFHRVPVRTAPEPPQTTSAAPLETSTPTAAPGTTEPSVPPPHPVHTSSATTSTGPTKHPTTLPTEQPTVLPTNSSSASPTASPTATPTVTATTLPTTTPTTTPTLTPLPTTTPTVAPTATPTVDPTPTAPPAPPTAAFLSISGSAHSVDNGGVVTFTGVVTGSDGEPLAGASVALQQGGAGSWSPIDELTSDSSGYVSFTAPPIGQSTAFRLHTKGSIHSPSWHVTEHPLLSASSSTDGGQAMITALAQGGSAGDSVTLVVRQDGQNVVVGTGTLDSSGTVAFAVTLTRRHTTYAVVLAETALHAEGRTTISVTGPRPSSSPSPSPS